MISWETIILILIMLGIAGEGALIWKAMNYLNESATYAVGLFIECGEY